MNFDNRKFIGIEKDEETFEIGRSYIGNINNRKLRRKIIKWFV